MPGAIRVFQICYDEATRASLDPDFEPLDNRANERPDWYEYWPMRQFFQRETLDETTYYGFFSPQFFAKTGLRGAQVKDFAAQAGEADVVTFSPHPCHGAVFYNVFEQGANCLPGFLDAATGFLREVDANLRLEQLVNDSRNTVYCNYFVARSAFWAAWGAVCDRLFECAEKPAAPLYDALNRAVIYAKDNGEATPAQMKIFILERVVSLLLATRRFTVRNFPPFALPLSAPFVGHLPEIVALDALKIAYAQTGEKLFLRQFVERRDRLAALAWRAGAPGLSR
jgi:hypothetical protein